MEVPIRLLSSLLLVFSYHGARSLDVVPVSVDPYMISTFTVTDINTTLNHFTVSVDGSIYIAGVDVLYHASQNLEVMNQMNISSDVPNINKILAIVQGPVNSLITCGSGLEQTCQLRDLSSLVREGEIASLVVAPGDSTTLGLVVDHPAPTATGVQVALYVAQSVTLDKRAERRPVSMKCLILEGGEGCIQTDDDDRMTSRLAGDVPSNFIVEYAAVFSHSRHTYFLASQIANNQDDTSPVIVPKLSRVCQTEEAQDMAGFTEITLVCKGMNNTLYNIARSAQILDGKLYAVFIDDSLDEVNPSNQSAICVYDMEELIAEFDAAIINCTCQDDVDYRSDSNWLSNSGCRLVPQFKCSSASQNHDTMICTTIRGGTSLARYPERNSRLGAIDGEIIFEQFGETFSSILVTKSDQPTLRCIGFIGTSQGHLLKLRLDDSDGFLYEKLELAYPILSDTWISDDNETITILTAKQLLKLSVANCDQYRNCDECIKPGTEDGDPYCGWCTLEKRCSRYHECSNSDAPDRWLYYDVDVCVKIDTVEPVDTGQKMVTLAIPHLPMARELNYSCHFGDSISEANVTANFQLICLSPIQDQIPLIPEGENAVEVTLSVSASGFDVKFITIPFYFFNCSRITCCDTCVTEWDCDWCVDDLECEYSKQSPCFIISSSTGGASDTCPQLLPMAEPIYVPANVDEGIEVTARNLNLTNELYKRELECVLDRDDGVQYVTEATKVPGSTPGEFTVICGIMQYTYQEDLQAIDISLTLRWLESGGVSLDGSVPVTLYKCSVDRPDCSRCLSELTTPPVLECRWCPSSPKSCVHESECGPGGIQDPCVALSIITSVSPPNGPIEGDTVVKISGTDLGQRFEDIGRITLAGIDCDHWNYTDMYMVGASVTCISGPSTDTGMGAVMVTVQRANADGDNMLLESEDSGEMFSYNNPAIESIFLMVGPMSGGTLIHITGTDLQTGRDITVMLDGEACTINSISTDVISCTNMVHNDSTTNTTGLNVTFDGHVRKAAEEFTFLPDPTVSDLNPGRSIESGGNLINVEGTGLDIIQRPQIVFTVDNREPAFGDYETATTEEMVCHSPRLSSIRSKRADGDIAATVNVGFIMDGVTGLLDWSVLNEKSFIVVPDPVYEEFPDGIDHDPRKGILKLGGTNLNLGSQALDVSVYIGDESCSNIVISLTDLTCSPPSKSPLAGDIYGGRTERGLPFIIVQHANLQFDIGYIKYISPPQKIILLIAVPAIAVLMIVAVCMLLLTWHVRRQKAKKINDLELQVREIQDSVSGNLKSLFATLETTAENFEAVLGEMKTIPLLSRRQYLLNMLFLGLETEPPKDPIEEVSGNPAIKTAMGKFSTNLLSKKNFLEVLVRTLDQDPKIGSMEKVNIASLLSVCLLHDGKQELLTKVITGLMREQIEGCDARAQRCRILFSRSETILEKLISNWVTVFQYQYLKDHAAMPLYHLFHAIKYVCEMGPVDAVTGHSQFSINDQQLLEMQINFNKLSISVIANSVTGEKTTLSVLDVNTVTQVKRKIMSFLYKDTPFSEQPDPYEQDLMWRTGKEGQLILRDDDDLPGNTEHEWRKLNTLRDFNVTSELANFELIDRQENPNTALTVQQNDYGESGQAPAATSGINRGYEAAASKHTSFNPAAFPPGTRPWHLVKEKDIEVDDSTQNKPKEIKEVVLPFLPATRKYIQKYVDSFLDVVLADQSDDISPAIKYIFQFFDQEADKLEKPEFAKAWKDNVFTLRYWTTILANPQYALDLGIHSYASASLRTLVQVVNDACAGRNKPNKTDFSPSRLLYSSFIPGYISKLTNFYLHVRDLGRVTSEDMVRECQRVEQDFAGVFDLLGTQYELYKILATHKEVLMQALEEDDVCQEADMATKLEAVGNEIAGE